MPTRATLVFAVAMCSFARAEVVTLAESGQAIATIVVQKDADTLVRAAADDVRHYVQAICGVELPLKDTGERVSGTGIYVGQCDTAEESDLPAADTNPETYVIRVRDGNLFLKGRHAPATAFAVVSFIEDNLGVRWYAPGKLWEFVPQGTPGALRVDVTSRVVTPDWSPRMWSGHEWTEDWKAWCLRNKAVCIAPVPFRNMQNHLHTVFAPEKYGESHPEYYPLIDGKRWIPPSDEHAWRPCESNPDVVRLTVEAAREYLDAHPEHNSFSLAMDDIYRLCGCDNCRAMDASPDDYVRKRFSDRHYKFVNAVAREIAKTHPDKYIGTLCYHIARELPSTVDTLEPNVFISMTQCCAEWWRPGRKEKDMELTRQWRERCKHMSRYDYMGLGFLTPRVFPHAMAEGMKFDHALGFEGVYNECYVILPNAAPMMWMVAKLQWNTELDADGLLDEFYAHMFGSASATMKEYYTLLEQSWMTPRAGRAGWGHRNLSTQAHAMSVEDIERAEGLLVKARESAADADVLRRIDIVAAGLQYGASITRMYALRDELDRVSLSTREEAEAVLRKVGELERLGTEREAFCASVMQRDDILGDSLRGLRARKYFVEDQTKNADLLPALLTALTVLKAQAPDEAAGMAQQFADAHAGPLGELAHTWAEVSRGDLPNLLRNPDFETKASGAATPEWSTWDNEKRDTHMTSVRNQGRDGSTGAAISNADSACYLQKVPVEAGQRYLCVAWARRTQAEDASSIRLVVRWQTPDGAWYPKPELEPSVSLRPSGANWQPMALVASVPEGAATLVFQLSVSAQGDKARALFDDAAVHLIPAK
ncbi:MAG: DUF4838 domain-containing protein [Candidatus Hydrogenedentales bacterium]